MRIRRTAGFTLVELLVVIAVIGILMALLMPAIQSARESARRTHCANNLKQIGIALHAYHTQFLIFPINYGYVNSSIPALNPPPGIPDPGMATSKGRSWMIGILPFAEEQKLYNRIRFDVPISDPSNTGAASTVVSLFLCPSDRGYKNGLMDARDLTGTWAVNSYKGVAGSNWDKGMFNDLYTEDSLGMKTPDIPLMFKYGRHAYLADGRDYGNGFVCRGGIGPKATSIADIRDGTDRTIIVGEVVPKYCCKTWWYWWDGATATCAIPMNYRPDGNDPDPADWQRTSSFRSMHNGGCFFLLADGTVRFLIESIDLTLYRNLAQIYSGQLKNVPQ